MLYELQNEKYNNYYAHFADTSKETLYEHTKLVSDYFHTIIKEHNLEFVIDNLTDEIINNYENKEAAKGFIRRIFYAIPEFHDIGKLNPNFQAVKMENERFNKIKISFGSDHSKIGAFLFVQNLLNDANNDKYSSNEKLINLFVLFAFSFSIRNHHSPNFYYENEYYFSDEFVEDVFKFVDQSLITFPREIQSKLRQMFNQKVLSEISEHIFFDVFSLFGLLKLNFSLLTASDYYATTHFMNNWDRIPDDFGVLDNELKKKIIKYVESSTHYNKRTYEKLQNYKLEFPEEATGDNLNKLRQNLSVEIINGIRENIDKNLFYIEAPTGGGKTNLSMLALAEFLRNDIESNLNNITKVFYVFPFTTLITQTFKSLKETLGLNDDEIVQIHSKSGFSQKKSDDQYGEKKLNIIDYQFVNYPVSVISHIKFFDILKSNKKNINYLLHRLANSVVIIDELQTYSPKEWDKVIYFINKYSKYYNIKFILMSATLPKIDKLLSKDVNFKKEEFVVLNKHKDKYFKNPNFRNRVVFDFSMLNNSDFDKNDKEQFLDNLWGKLIEESKTYRENSKDKRVHAIIEFIFKKTATEFINIANENKELFDEIFILSGTTLEPRRREIINKLKSEEYQSKSILLITTQVVEAGVDIDMDLGFKDSSLIDSDEQLAGRINRNVNKPQCKLFIFDYDDAKVIYGKDYRFNKIKNELKEKYSEILETKNFDLVYDSVMEDKDYHNEQSGYADNLPAYIKNIRNLDYDLVNKEFRLIEDSVQTTILFIPIKIPIEIPCSEEQNFNEKELDFLKKKNKYNDEDYVDGENVWQLYCEIIENKDEDFTKQKVQKIIMQGLLSKFSFSISTYSKSMKDITTSGNGEEKYGYYKLNNVYDVYDYENGLKEMKFEDIYFW